MTAIELFNHRFYKLPATFYFFEIIQVSRVERYHVCLKMAELNEPKLISQESASKAQKSGEQPKEENKLDKLDSIGTADVKLMIMGSSNLDSSILSIEQDE